MTFVTMVLVVLASGSADDVVARVDGATVTQATFVRHAAAGRASGRTATAEQVLESCVTEAVLAAEGRRLGAERDPLAAMRTRAERRRASVQLLVQKEFTQNTPPSESTVREMFQSLADSVAFESLTFDSRESAQAARERIGKGSTFAAEARTAVTSQLYPAPAAAPAFMRGQLEPALAKELFSAPAGQVIGPVEMKVGWVLARPLKTEKGGEAAFAAQRDSLVKRAKDLSTKEGLKHIFTQLRAKAAVKLDEAFLQALRGLDASAQQLEHVIATVHGAPVRYGEVHALLLRLGGDGHMAGPTVRIQLAWQRIDDVLLEDLAIERGYDKAQEIVAREPEFERAGLAVAASERIQASAPPPTEDEIAAFYRRNADAFGQKFEAVLPAAAAGARNEKRVRTLAARVAELRKRASVSVDQKVLATVFTSAT